MVLLLLNPVRAHSKVGQTSTQGPKVSKMPSVPLQCLSLNELPSVFMQ